MAVIARIGVALRYISTSSITILDCAVPVDSVHHETQWTDPGWMPLAVVNSSSVAHRVETCPVGRLSEKNNELDCSVLREE